MKKNLIIIGTGAIAEKHCKAIQKLKQLKIYGAFDINKSKLTSFAKKYEIKPFYSLKDIKKKIKLINYAVILTPSGMHYDSIRNLSKIGLKNFIVEKPLAIEANHIQNIKKLAKKKQLNIIVVNQYRYTELIKKLKIFIEKKLLGKIYHIGIKLKWKRDQNYYDKEKWRGTKKLDGGVLMNQGHHFIDLIFFLFKKITNVYGITNNILAKIETYDTAKAIFKINNFLSGTIEATTASRPENLEGSLTVMGTKGTVILGGFSANENNYWKIIKNKKMKNFKFKNNKNQPLLNFYKEVLKTKKNSFKYVDDAFKTVKFIKAVENSSKFSKNIKIN